MKTDRSRKLFDRISPVYSLYYRWQREHYRAIYSNRSLMDLSPYTTILDVGCGTAAMTSILNELGHRVTGVDNSLGMLQTARKQVENSSLGLLQASAVEGLPFAEKSFEVSIAAYVAHGLKSEQRQALYSEMKRVSSKWVILHDYNQNRSLMTNIAEYLEGGDYFNFIQVVQTELRDFFGNLKVVDLGGRASCYLCVV